MASPRKRYFYVADAILRDDLTRDQRSTFLGLLAWFNQRRQRDGYRDARAQEASIPPGDLLTITLSDTLEAARECCENIRERYELTIEARGSFTFIRWPNLAKFQEWERPSAARPLPGGRPAAARPKPLPVRSGPAPDRHTRKEEEEERPASPAEPAPLPSAARSDDAEAPAHPVRASQIPIPPEAEALARQLAAHVLEALPGQKIPRDLSAWARDVDRIHRIDGVPWIRIEQVMDWTFENEFWRLNIRSAGKLRVQFPRLNAEENRRRIGAPGKPDPKRPSYPGAAWDALRKAGAGEA